MISFSICLPIVYNAGLLSTNNLTLFIVDFSPQIYEHFTITYDLWCAKVTTDYKECQTNQLTISYTVSAIYTVRGLHKQLLLFVWVQHSVKDQQNLLFTIICFIWQHTLLDSIGLLYLTAHFVWQYRPTLFGSRLVKLFILVLLVILLLAK